MKIETKPVPRDGAAWTCPHMERLDRWPYVKRCGLPVVGFLPQEVIDTFKLDYSTICEKHLEMLKMELVDEDDDEDASTD
jgi:hypothetical protein